MKRVSTTATEGKQGRIVSWSISLLVHLMLIPLFVPVYESKASQPPKASPPAAPLKLVSSKAAKELLKPRAQPPQTKKEPPQKLPKAPVVSLSKVTQEIATKKARYLATVNNQTSRETVSRQRGLQQIQRQKSSARSATDKQSRPQTQRRRSTASPRVKRRQTAAGKLRPTNSANSDAQSEQSLTALSSLEALLFQASRDNTTAAKGTPEDVRGVEAGDETILNTRAYKHSWFFNRVVGALYQHWRANEAHRAHDPTGKVYGIRDRKTVIAVVLDGSGNLIDARILETSGAPHLDDEAIAAFRRAQPFPNPPSELSDTDGRIRFPMGFRLEFGKPQFFRMR